MSKSPGQHYFSQKPTAAGVRHGLAGWVPRPRLSLLHLGMPPALAFGTRLQLNADRRVTAARGCVVQGPCKACTQAGCDVASPLCKGPLFPSKLLAWQAGHGKAQPEEPTQRHPCEDGTAAPGFAALTQTMPAVVSAPSPALSCRAGQATSLCNPVVPPPLRSAHRHQLRVTQPWCPRDSRTRVQGFPAGRVGQRERKKKDEFLLQTLG